jgi:large subunit ribosomal protein L13
MPLRAQRTFSPRPQDITRDWWLVDAEGQTLGRLAAQIARILRGKHKPIFAPHVDTGDFVIIVNAEKVAVAPQKLGEYRYRHSGYPGGLSKRTVGELLESKPERLVELAVKGMLPKNTLGRAQLKKLKVYSGPSHPHAAQTPKEFQITQVAQ